MQEVKVTVAKKDGTEGQEVVSFSVDYGDNLQELVAKNGEAVAYSAAIRQLTTDIANYVRAACRKTPANQDAIVAAAKEKKPGVKAVSVKAPVDPIAALRALAASGNLSPEEKKAKLAEARAALGL